MADDAFNGTGTLPDYIYWKLDASSHFTVLNPAIDSDADASWTRESWLIGLHSDATTYQQWITKDWRNYIDEGPAPGIVRYIFPIPEEAITNSQGTLKNDGYGF
ncbi:MAG: hypothetical protein R2778_10315 [Saprospiraceae bacterium]